MEENQRKKKKWKFSGTKKGWELSEEVSRQLLFSTHVVNLLDEPVSLDNFQNFDPNIRVTAGYYTLTYQLQASKRYVEGKPFIIGQDMIRMRVCVSGPEHWECLANEIPELNWIRRNSYLTRELFQIAKLHPGMNFTFSVDWVRYAALITAKAMEQGIDIKNRAFVTFECPQEAKDRMNEQYKLIDKKDKYDYAEQIRAAELKPQAVLERSRYYLENDTNK